MIIKRSIKFSLQSQSNALKRIRMRVTYNGKRLEFQTGVTVKAAAWDPSKQRIKSLSSEDSQTQALNELLSTMAAKMIEAFQHYELIGKVPTPEEIRKIF